MASRGWWILAPALRGAPQTVTGKGLAAVKAIRQPGRPGHTAWIRAFSKGWRGARGVQNYARDERDPQEDGEAGQSGAGRRPSCSLGAETRSPGSGALDSNKQMTGRWKGHATGRGAHKDAGEGMIDALQFGGQNRVVEVQQLSGGEAWRAGSAHQEPTGGSPFGDSLNAWRRRSEGKPEGSGDLFSSHQIASGQGHAGRAQQEPLVPSYSQDQPRRPQQMVSIQSERRAHENRRQTPPNVWLSRPVWGEAADGTPPPETTQRLTAEVLDSVMLLRDPTDALQEVSRRAMMKDKNGEWVHLDLWWMREMIEIRYGEMDEAEQKRAREGKGKILINHVIQVVKQAPPRLRVRWAALLHDVGKAATVTVDAKSQKLQFRKHESVGGTMVDSILASYGYHEQFRREVATLVLRSGRIRSVENFHDQGARRLLSVSGPLFIDLLDLYKADCTSMSPRRQQEHQDRAHQLVSLVKGVLTRDIMRIKRPPLNGNEVMALTGLTAGIALGRLMRGLREDYLSRGPYTYDEAVQVALRLHKEYLKVPECKSTRKLSKLSFLKKVLCDEDEEGLVFRIMLDQGAGQSERSPWRDIVVQRNTSLFDFAAAVVHAFDFDFDDRFSFFRRSRVGSSCPGAEAACSGIDDALLPHRKDRVEKYPWRMSSNETSADEGIDRMRGNIANFGGETVQAGTVVGDVSRSERVGNYGSEQGEGVFADVNVGGEFELLASTPGIPKELTLSGLCFSYDVRYCNELEDWTTPQGESLVQDGDGEGDESFARWKVPGADRNRGGPKMTPLSIEGGDNVFLGSVNNTRVDREDDHDRLWGHRADTLSYPLKLPQKGPASLSNTQVGSLFDRSRRSMVLLYENGGPWRFWINFVQFRAMKPYEEAPQVCARMGKAPAQYGGRYEAPRDPVSYAGMREDAVEAKA